MSYRKPFGLEAKDIPPDRQFTINYSFYDTSASYRFKSCDSDLLIDIDCDNAAGVEQALATDKIDVNTRYVIPSWEVPEAGRPMLQTFLHRALWTHAADVFGLLLKKGANPRIKGHCDSTVIQDLFDGHTPKKDVVKFGKMLIDAGVKVQELQAAIDNCQKKYYATSVKTLMQYAQSKPHRICRKKIKAPSKEKARIRN